MRRRGGRPGLIGTMARTAVITKTATTVAGNTQRRQAAQAQEAAQAAAPQAAPQAAPPPPPAPAAPAGTDDLIDQLGKLADLKAAGVLDDAEFAAAKARLLGT